MAETVVARRAKLRYAQQLLNELIQLNEQAGRIQTTLAAQGVSDSEIVITMDKTLGQAGPPQDGTGDVDECTGDKITDRLFNILNDAVTDGVDWGAALT
jgi:hypothetical protein